MERKFFDADLERQRGNKYYGNFIQNVSVKNDEKKAKRDLNMALKCYRNSIDLLPHTSETYSVCRFKSKAFKGIANIYYHLAETETKGSPAAHNYLLKCIIESSNCIEWARQFISDECSTYFEERSKNAFKAFDILKKDMVAYLENSNFEDFEMELCNLFQAAIENFPAYFNEIKSVNYLELTNRLCVKAKDSWEIERSVPELSGKLKITKVNKVIA